MKTQKRICKICGLPDSEHHDPEYIEIPEGCICDIYTWNYEVMNKIPPACSKYVGNGMENCHKCEHDKECHRKASK
jgi:hypothetical protein